MDTNEHESEIQAWHSCWFVIVSSKVFAGRENSCGKRTQRTQREKVAFLRSLRSFVATIMVPALPALPRGPLVVSFHAYCSINDLPERHFPTSRTVERT